MTLDIIKFYKVFRIYWSWLGKDQNDSLDIMEENMHLAIAKAIMIENKHFKANYSINDVIKCELVAEVASYDL